MTDKMMRVSGRGSDGKAKAVRVDNGGNVGFYDSSTVTVFDNDLMGGSSVLTSSPVSVNGSFVLQIKFHSETDFKLAVEYLGADRESVVESEDLFEGYLRHADNNELEINFEPKKPHFRFVIQSSTTSDRRVWLTLVKTLGETMFEWLDFEKNSVVDVFSNVDVLSNGSVTSDLINTGGYPLNLALNWSSGTDMRVRIDAEYYDSNGVALGKDENILYTDHTQGERRRIIPFIPRHNLIKFIVSNDGEEDRRIDSLSLSRVRDSKVTRITQVLNGAEWANSNFTQVIDVPPHAYGASLYLIIKDYTPNKNAEVSLRVRNAFEHISGYATGIHSFEGWETDIVSLEGKGKPSVLAMHISPEAMYLQSFPPDENAMSSNVLGLKLCPAKVSDKLHVRIAVNGDFAEGEGIEYEMICEWHV